MKWIPSKTRTHTKKKKKGSVRWGSSQKKERPKEEEKKIHVDVSFSLSEGATVESPVQKNITQQGKPKGMPL